MTPVPNPADRPPVKGGREATAWDWGHVIGRVLADPEWNRQVVTAAVRALAALEGPDPTRDGDDPAMCARTALRTAFLDTATIRSWQEGTTA